jgi:LPXTG-motif cell wall-anchored protein
MIGIPDFFLDFATYWTEPGTGELILIDGAPVPVDDGLDRIFGDYGYDWIVGGTYFDWLFGGWGQDILDLDDNHWTNGGLNNIPEPDEWFRQGDFAYGGADRDVLIGNSAMDRMFDWEGDFNDFYVPFAFYGAPTVNRFYTPAIARFIRRLAYAGGTDVLLTPFEPFDEPAIIPGPCNRDFSQCGPPRWPDVPHNVPGVRRDNIRGTDPVCVCWTPPRSLRTTGQNLPSTGSELEGLLLAASALVAAGGVLLIGTRRRRTSVR